MSQRNIVHNIMKELIPSIARYIGIIENKTLKELKPTLESTT